VADIFDHHQQGSYPGLLSCQENWHLLLPWWRLSIGGIEQDWL